MGVRPVKQATCMCCKEKFDRNKVPFIVSNTSPTNPRYIHASCAEEYALKTKRVFDKPIDPSKEYMCEFCHKGIPIGQEITLPGDRFAHVDCYSKDESHNKSDYDKLFEYIMKLYDESFVDPAKQKSIKNMIDSYGFTYSGIHGTLVYIYEIKGFKPKDSNYLGIVPYYYNKAKNYYTELKKVKEINAAKDIENYSPKEIIVKRKERKQVSFNTKKKFSVLDEDDINAE